MTFGSGPAWTGFTFNGWSQLGTTDFIAPTFPNVNSSATIAVNSGCWNLISFQTMPYSGNNPPGEGTWEASDDLGDTYDFTISSTTQTITLNWSNIHTLTIHLTNNGPSGSNPNQVYGLGNIIYNSPVPASAPSVTAGNSPICPGTSTTLTITGNLNDASQWVIYTGSCGGARVGSTTSNSFQVTPSTSTTYYVRGEGSCAAAGSCGTATVETFTLPTASIGGSTSSCAGAPVNLSIRLTGTAPWNVTYSDGSTTNTISISSSPYTLTVSPTVTTTYTLTALSDANCSSNAAGLSGSAEVTMGGGGPQITTNVSTTGQSVCFEAPVSELNVYATGSGLSYQWYSNTSGVANPSADAKVGANIPSYAPNSLVSGTTYYYVVVSGTCGSPVTSTVAPVTVIPLPQVLAIPGGDVCQGTTAIATFFAGGGIAPYTFTYNINGGNSQSVSTSGASGTATVIAPTNVPGQVSINLIAVQNGSSPACPQTITGQTTVFQVNALPTAAISGGATYCNGQSTTTNLSIAVTGSGTISGMLSDGTDFSGTAPTITVSVSPASTTTYTITSLNDANCSSQAGDLSGSATVVVNPRPTAVISGGGTYCNGQTTTTDLSIAVTGTGTVSGILSDGTSFSGTAPTITVQVSPVSSTTYTITSLNDANCSSQASDLSGSAAVVVNPRPTASINQPNSVFCSGQNTSVQLNINVTGTGVISGTLSDGTAFSGTAPTITVSVSPVTTTTYTIATLSDANCTSDAGDLTGSMTIYINNPPSAVISGGAIYCNGQSTTTNLTLAVTGSGVISGTLSDGTPFSGTAPTITVSVSPATTTIYTIASLSDANNCPTQPVDLSGSATVTVNNRPTASISGGAAYCNGQSTTTNLVLTVTGSGVITGTLSDGTPFSGTAPTITVSVSPSSTTIYSIGTMSDANCTSQASDLTGSATVSVNPLPTGTISGTTAVCQNSTDPTITFTGSLGSGSYTFAYTLTDGTNLSTGTVTGSPSGTLLAPTSTGGTYTYTLTGVTDNNTSCTQAVSNQTAVITVNPLPSASIISASMVTAVSTGNSASVPDAGTGAVYSWTISNGSIQGSASSSSISYTAGVTGSVTLNVAVTSGVALGSGCGPVNGTLQVPITPQPCPNPKITVPWEICSGSIGNIASVANAGAGAKYLWSISDGAITSGSGTDQITYTANANTFADFLPGNFVWLSVKVTNSSGVCTVSSGSYPVFIDPLPVTSIYAASSVCASSSGNIARIPNAGTGAKYTWTISGGTISAGAGANQITYTANASGTVTIAVTVTNALGCASSSGNKSVSIASFPVAAITVSGAVCSASKANTASVSSAGAGAIYSWSINNGVITSGFNTSSIAYTAGISGSVTLSVKVTNSSGCSTSSGNKIVPIVPLPSVAITSGSAVCSLSAGNTASAPTGASAYAWTITNGAITKGSGASAITYTAGASGTMTISVSVTNSNGCKSSASIIVAISAKVLPTFTQLGAICQNATPPLLPLKSLNGITGTWTPAKINVASTGSTTYTFTPGSGQCASATSVKITIEKCAVEATVDQLDSKTVPSDEPTPAKMTVAVWPSPTQTSFSLIVSGQRTEVAEIRIFDMTGRVLDHQRAAKGEIVRFGVTYMTGMYIVEVLQGPERKVVKVIKN